jgi:hypothetical protein
MKDTYTEMETFVARDGNTILVRKDKVLEFFANQYELNHASLTDEEKQAEFLMNQLYADVIFKVYKEPLQLWLSGNGSELKQFTPPHVDVAGDYERLLAAGPAEHESQESFDLKLQRLKNHKDWIENNT